MDYQQPDNDTIEDLKAELRVSRFINAVLLILTSLAWSLVGVLLKG